MMEADSRNILAIETSESVCSVALGSRQKLLGEISLNKLHAHNERLAWMVDWLLKEQNMSMKNISRVLISAGPGSYTGLRIGFSFARGLIYSNKTPLIPVPTPEIYAFKGREENVKIVSVMDARRKELYMGEYKFENGIIKEETPVSIITIDDFFKKYSPKKEKNEKKKIKIKLAGSGLNILMNFTEENEFAHLWDFPNNIIEQITANDLFLYGNTLLDAGLENNYNLEEPLYVRDFKGTY